MAIGFDYGSNIRDVAPLNLKLIKQTTTLSKIAKQRLTWIDYYYSHNNNAALACRHFGIARSCFFKWKKRCDLLGLKGLEDKSKRPDNVRQSLIPIDVLNTVKILRKNNPELSKYKLAVILKRDYGFNLSASTVGRIITKYNLFFKPPIKQKGHAGRRSSIIRTRKPKGYIPLQPGELVEFDVKHLPSVGTKRYGFVTIDVITKQASVYVSSTITSKQGTIAWKRAKHELGLTNSVQVITDNGSENLGAFADLLESQNVRHYFARPHTPKDKPHVERFIGSLERECLQWGGVAIDKTDQQTIIDEWLKKYHNYRPHQALNYLTPNEFKAKLKAEATSMY
jgi:hypothetical protein